MNTESSARRTSLVRRAYTVLVPALVVLWFLSGINRDASPNDPGIHWAGVFWALFGVAFVATVLLTVGVGIAALRRRRIPTGVDA